MINAVENMSQYGGSFVKMLARLWCVADPVNKEKIETTWQDVFERYKNMGEKK